MPGLAESLRWLALVQLGDTAVSAWYGWNTYHHVFTRLKANNETLHDLVQLEQIYSASTAALVLLGLGTAAFTWQLSTEYESDRTTGRLMKWPLLAGVISGATLAISNWPSLWRSIFLPVYGYFLVKVWQAR